MEVAKRNGQPESRSKKTRSAIGLDWGRTEGEANIYLIKLRA